MRLTINLDTHAVTTNPSPLRIKADCDVPFDVAFTRGSQPVTPQGVAIELGLKVKGQFDAGLLIFHDQFSPASGGVFSGIVNAATAQLQAALGIGNNTQVDDKPQVELVGELAWTISGQHYRSQSFSVYAEPPVIYAVEPTPIPIPEPTPPAPVPNPPPAPPPPPQPTPVAGVLLLSLLQYVQAVPGMLAYDALGRLFLCYAPRRWKMFTGTEYVFSGGSAGSTYSVGAKLV